LAKQLQEAHTQPKDKALGTLDLHSSNDGFDKVLG